MAATTTPSISWLISRLNQLLPEVTYLESDGFAWLPTAREISYQPTAADAAWQLLHESGHAAYQHQGYRRDIELLGYEVEAWSAAQELARQLGLEIPEKTIEQHMDTYRDWLHDRSQCIDCAQTGIQIAADRYRCLHCPSVWRVNDARRCGLRRYRSQASA